MDRQIDRQIEREREWQNVINVLASGVSTVLDNKLQHPKVQGSSPVAVTGGTWREKNVIKVINVLDSGVDTLVENKLQHTKAQGSSPAATTATQREKKMAKSD